MATKAKTKTKAKPRPFTPGTYRVYSSDTINRARASLNSVAHASAQAASRPFKIVKRKSDPTRACIVDKHGKSVTRATGKLVTISLSPRTSSGAKVVPVSPAKLRKSRGRTKVKATATKSARKVARIRRDTPLQVLTGLIRLDKDQRELLRGVRLLLNALDLD